MLTKSQVHKETDGHVHGNVEDDNGIADNSCHALEGVKTLVDQKIYKNENSLLDCMDDMYPYKNEDLSLINRDEEKSISEGEKKHDQQAKSMCDSSSKDVERVNIRNDEDVRINMTV